MDSTPHYYNLTNERSDDEIRPLAMVSQLMQSIASMRHIDELFMWIANTIVQRLNMKSVQIWAMQAEAMGAAHIKLRASSSQHYFQIQQMSENAEVGGLVERMLREGRGILSIPVANIFSQYQATILAQQNCQYWTVYILSKNVLLPPMQRRSREEEIPTPLQMAFSFFTQQPLQASHTRAISFLVEQALRIALSRGLFSLVMQQQPSGPQPGLAQLIPEHIQSTEIEQAENPFSNAVVIPEKRARQVYSLIDGKKNIAELALSTHMGPKDILEILQSFLAQGYIKLRDARGIPVEALSLQNTQFYRGSVL